MKAAYKGIEASLQEVEECGSFGEKQIARMLTHYGIRFSYEHPVAVVHRGKVRVWYPDFWLPEYGVVVEYAGVVGDDAYTEGIMQKKTTYAASGFPCIVLNAESLRGRWSNHLLDQIRDVVIERHDQWDCLEERLGRTGVESRESAVYA